MTDCILRHYLMHIPDGGEEISKKVRGDRFVGEYYQLFEDVKSFLLQIDCGKREKGFEVIDDNWHFIPYRSPSSRIDRLLRVKIEERHIGWVVPIESIVERENALSEFDDEDDLIDAIEAVTLSLIKHPNCIAFSRFRGSGKEFGIRDFYDDDFGVIFLRKDDLPDSMVAEGIIKEEDEVSFRISLIHRGYLVKTPEDSNFHNKMEWPLTERNLPIKSISDELIPYAKGIEWVLLNVVEDTNPTGVFLGLYQIIETLLSIVFRTMVEAIRDLHIDVHNPYKYSEILTRIPTDKYRLSWLFSEFCNFAGTRIPSILMKSCNLFLNKFDSKDEGTCHEALYSVRTQVVHRQIKWRPSEALENLLDAVNTNLIGCVFSMLTSFNSSTGYDKLKTSFKESLENLLTTEGSNEG